MSALAPTLEAFFTERLMTQRRASPRTIAAYRDTFRLLLGFVHQRTGKAPTQLDLADLGAGVVGTFLSALESDRHNSVRTRNARLAAIHSLFRYAALRHPEHADLVQRVLAIPSKRYERTDPPSASGRPGRPGTTPTSWSAASATARSGTSPATPTRRSTSPPASARTCRDTGQTGPMRRYPYR